MKLTEIYLSIDENCKNQWKNERELKDKFQNELSILKKNDINKYISLKTMYDTKKISAIDAVYKNDLNQNIGIEIITKNYSDEMISAKEKFANMFNIELQKIII